MENLVQLTLLLWMISLNDFDFFKENGNFKERSKAMWTVHRVPI